jgi:hypothetical protein
VTNADGLKRVQFIHTSRERKECGPCDWRDPSPCTSASFEGYPTGCLERRRGGGRPLTGSLENTGPSGTRFTMKELYFCGKLMLSMSLGEHELHPHEAEAIGDRRTCCWMVSWNCTVGDCYIWGISVAFLLLQYLTISQWPCLFLLMSIPIAFQ